MTMLNCPRCGKQPKVIRDYAYESMSFGAWCVIQCKPLFQKYHFKTESGKATWERAYKEAVFRWNYCVRQHMQKSQDYPDQMEVCHD